MNSTSQIWDFDTVFTPTNLINSPDSVIFVCGFCYPEILIPIFKPTCFHQFMVRYLLLPAGNHAILRDILAKFSFLFIPCPHLMKTPVLILVLCQTCFSVHFCFSYISLLFTAVLFTYLFSPISSTLWSSNWICFLVLFHWFHKLYP